MSETSLPTKFAPAERATAGELVQQASYLAQVDAVRPFLDAVPDMFAMLNAQRQILFANRALLELLQADQAHLIGLRPGEAFGCIHAAEEAGGCGTSEHCQVCGAARAILAAVGGSEEVLECQVAQKDGDVLDLLVRATPFQTGAHSFVSLAVKDIAHEKRLRTLERIFFHDVLNTANGLQMLAETLPRASAAERDELGEILPSLTAKLLEEITSQRDLLAAENRELAVHPVTIAALPLLAEVMAVYEKYETIAERAVCLAADAQSFALVSDKLLLRRVLSNMLKNALEATPRGGVVTVGCRAEGEIAEFWVHNPSFMPREVQLQVFQRSFSTKGKGRGLGTYSMKLLSERYLCGSVSFTSSPEEGTVFRARYPMRLDAPEALI